jgi:hypothetical protein
MTRVRRADIEEENRRQLNRQREFRRAADIVTEAFAAFAEVRAVAVIGSVARPLWKEVPRFREFRRARIEIWHECHDVDLAVWLDAQHRLGEMRRARDRALVKAHSAGCCVASHQLDVFLFEPVTDTYLGRLCNYAECPKGKPDCFVPGCGAIPFNKRIPEFVPRADLLATARDTMLYERGAGRLRSALDLPASL